MSVSIVIPTYNRTRFERMIEYNLNIQDYYNLIEVIILDDSDKDRPLCIRTPIPIRYYTVPRMTIGQKRNCGVKLAQGDYVAFFDTDDMYSSEYISHSIFEMETSGKTIAGSADMVMYDGKQFYKQSCVYLHFLNEATMVFKKSAWSPFGNVNSNEAVPFLEKNIENIVETDITRVMCCLCHKDNTVDKTPWTVDKYKTNPMSQYSKHLQLLSSINVYESP